MLQEENNYKKLKDCFYIPYLENVPEINDYTKEGRNELLHCALISIQKFYDKENRLPEINNLTDAKKVLINFRAIYENAKNKNEEWIDNIEDLDEKILINVARWSKCEISPLCSFLGDIFSQEVVKATGKYMPFNQWLLFDFFETIENLKENIDRNINGSRYDEQIVIFGNESKKN